MSTGAKRRSGRLFGAANPNWRGGRGRAELFVQAVESGESFSAIGRMEGVTRAAIRLAIAKHPDLVERVAAARAKRPPSLVPPTYRSWLSMRARTLNPNAVNWERYGGRGITVCDRWSTFAPFLEDMGERPEGTTLDRIDSNGHYEPGNCRWATPLEQRHNRRVAA